MVPLPRGTLLNTATVVAGGLIGWGIGEHIPPNYKLVAMSGIGLVTAALGLKMFFQAKHILIIVGAIVFGGMIGLALGFQAGIENVAVWAKHMFGGEQAGRFSEAIVTTSILFCVGPLTLLGCLQDGIEGKIELLAIKSMMDGISSLFFAAALGPGVLVTAGVLLVFQSLLTFLASPLRPIAKDEELLSEITGSGGIILVGIGLGLLNVCNLPMASYLPALVLAPLGVIGIRRGGRD